jgi:type II secretory pathway component GspD/PulD (secretin)
VLTATAAETKAAAAAPAADRAEAAIKVFSLTKARAADLAKAIRPLLEGQPIVIAVDERSNSIIAQGTVEQLDIARALIFRLDGAEVAAPQDAQTRSPPKFFALNNAQASNIVRVMQPILEGKPVTIGFDERSNSIIVTAGEQDMEVVAALIERLDEK